MIVNRKNIIIATEKVIDLDSDARRKLILTLLETNPTIVLRALDIGTAPKLWKVAITDRNNCQNKINVIKAFRQISGNGLADSKAWSEGQTVSGLPSGVFGHGLNREEANELWKRVTNELGSAISVKVEVISNDIPVTPLPYTWSTPTQNW